LAPLSGLRPDVAGLVASLARRLNQVDTRYRDDTGARGGDVLDRDRSSSTFSKVVLKTNAASASGLLARRKEAATLAGSGSVSALIGALYFLICYIRSPASFFEDSIFMPRFFPAVERNQAAFQLVAFHALYEWRVIRPRSPNVARSAGSTSLAWPMAGRLQGSPHSDQFDIRVVPSSQSSVMSEGDRKTKRNPQRP
jgi:hypothetical protein